MPSSYKDLRIWQRGMDLCRELYRLTKTFPEDEKFALISQMRRAAVSIPSNIAEGSRRGTKKDFRKFLYIAYGSGAELETQLILAKDLGYTINNIAAPTQLLLDETMRMLNAFIASMR